MYTPKTEKITLFGEDLILSERTAEDVNSVIAYSKQSTEKEYQDVVIEAAIVVADSLKANDKALRWFQFLKKLKYKRICNINYLIKNLSPNQIFALCSQVYALEGIEAPKADQKKN